MTWRLARSLSTLRDEINKNFPDRSTISDGTIGDPAHASRPSDHNPNPAGVVRAMDITHDPVHGPVGTWLANTLAELLGNHPALGSGAYVIWNSQIISTDRILEDWRPYDGENPHDHHVHISVQTNAPGYDSAVPWLTRKEPRMRIVGFNMHEAKDAKPVRRLIQRLLLRWVKRPDVICLQEARFAHKALRLMKLYQFVGGGSPISDEDRAELVTLVHRRCRVIWNGYERVARGEGSSGPKSKDRGTQTTILERKGVEYAILNAHCGFTTKQVDEHIESLRDQIKELQDEDYRIFIAADANAAIRKLSRLLTRKGFAYRTEGVDIVGSTVRSTFGKVRKIWTGSDHDAVTARTRRK